MVHAELLADALDEHAEAGGRELVVAFADATRRELEPWYHASVQADEPNALMSDPELLSRVMHVYQERDQREPDPPLGPPREVLMDALASREPAA
jgi:hypothetical protein